MIQPSCRVRNRFAVVAVVCMAGGAAYALVGAGLAGNAGSVATLKCAATEGPRAKPDPLARLQQASPEKLSAFLSGRPLGGDTWEFWCRDATFDSGGVLGDWGAALPSQTCKTHILVTWPGLQFISADCQNPCAFGCFCCITKTDTDTTYSCICSDSDCP
jgi:hypothetical protein